MSSYPRDVFRLYHVVGWPISSTASCSVTLSPHSERAIWSPTSPVPSLSRGSLCPPTPTPPSHPHPHPRLFVIWPHSHAAVKATWVVHSAMMISVPQMCHAEVHLPLSCSFRPQLYYYYCDLSLQPHLGSVHCCEFCGL